MIGFLIFPLFGQAGNPFLRLVDHVVGAVYIITLLNVSLQLKALVLCLYGPPSDTLNSGPIE